MESQKSEFRKYCKISLEKLSKAQNKIFLDSKLQKNLLTILSQEIQHLRKKTKRPLKILLYYPLAIEFNGKKVLKTLRKQKNIEIFLPFMGDISFKIVKFRLPLHREKFGVLQPSNSYRKINLIDIAIIPVIGIDNQFKRIGFGKGMYDRFFNTQKKIPRILFICRGIFYSSLNITQYHDIKGNSLITPLLLYALRISMITWMFVSSALSALVAGGGSYLFSRKLLAANSKTLLEQYKAKAKAIEYEANKLLQESKIKAKEIELESKRRSEKESVRITKEHENNLLELEKIKIKENQKLEREYYKLEQEKNLFNKDRNIFNEEQEALKVLKSKYQSMLQELTRLLCSITHLSKEEARELLFEKIKEEAKIDAAKLIRKYEEDAKEEAKAKANYILAQATTRFAGEFAAERLTQIIALPSDDFKAKIIGKEGRNIKALEMTCGVDIIIDDSPGIITISSHNLYRRSIAAKAIQNLIEDGRIQPARIEEVYQKCLEEFENSILEEGERITLDLGLNGIHTEIKKLIGRLRYRASYGQNALEHSLEVANLAGIIAGELGGDCLLAIRAGLLHDIGKARTHEYKGTHVELGAEIAKRYNEHPAVLNAILAHHGNEEAKSIEVFAVCAADTISAARPGARREVLESYLRRVSEMEQIALSKMGVLHAYAINTGREIRVIVKSEDINDEESYLLAREIAKEIQSQVQYPGEVKVNVIRETRACAIAG